MRTVLFALILLLGSGPLWAEQTRGPVTNLPLPRYVSIKAAEANVRRGPSLSHRVDWVFKKRNLPLEIVAEHGHWRRVRDIEGAGGWVHYSLLSGARYVQVTADMVDLHKKPLDSARVVARAERGALARLGSCDPLWCEVMSGRIRGWVPKDRLWGVLPDELRE